MKLIIASDIHGCLTYTQKLEKLINIEQPNNIILLGDILYFNQEISSPLEYDSHKTATILNKYQDKIIAVRGNCDSKSDDQILKFDITRNYIDIKIDDINFFLTHGHLTSWYIDKINGKVVLCGHTHQYNLDGQYINPGSVGIPRKSTKHTCIIYDNKTLSLIDLDDFSIIEQKHL